MEEMRTIIGVGRDYFGVIIKPNYNCNIAYNYCLPGDRIDQEVPGVEIHPHLKFPILLAG